MELVYSKDYFNLAKIFTIKNGGELKCSRLEQSSVIKFLVTEKSKSWETYRRMSDVYGEGYFNQKNLQMG